MTAAVFSFKERFQQVSTQLLGQLPSRLQLMLAGGQPIRQADRTLSSQLQLLYSLMDEQPCFDPRATEELERSHRRFRHLMLMMAGQPLDIFRSEDFTIELPDRQLSARLYQPFDSIEPLPTLMFLHGGGFVMGDLDTHDSICRLLCAHAGIQVLSLDYRLAPQHDFPAALHDSVESWQWVIQHSDLLHADPQHWMIGGDSSGATLALATCQTLRDLAVTPPSLQLLLYPGLQTAALDPLFLNDADRAFFTALNRQDGGIYDSMREMLRVDHLQGLAPMFLVTAGFCPIREQHHQYADILKHHGVSVWLKEFPHLTHGFASLTGMSSDCYRAMVDVAEQTAQFAFGESHKSFSRQV
jgi:acetyl esterase